jgi:hypothetical protein
MSRSRTTKTASRSSRSARAQPLGWALAAFRRCVLGPAAASSPTRARRASQSSRSTSHAVVSHAPKRTCAGATRARCSRPSELDAYPGRPRPTGRSRSSTHLPGSPWRGTHHSPLEGQRGPILNPGAERPMDHRVLSERPPRSHSQPLVPADCLGTDYEGLHPSQTRLITGNLCWPWAARTCKSPSG